MSNGADFLAAAEGEDLRVPCGFTLSVPTFSRFAGASGLDVADRAVLELQVQEAVDATVLATRDVRRLGDLALEPVIEG